MKIVKVALLSAFCLLLVNGADAQGPPPPPPTPTSGTDVPIDNEVVLLLLAVCAFGVYKLRNKKIAA